MKAIDFSQFIQNRIANIESIDSFVFAFAVGIGPWIVPTSGAAIFAYSLHEWAPENMGDLRLYAAVAAGLGLIIAGAVSSDNAIAAKTPEAWRLVYGYISLEIIGLWFMSVGWDVKVVGTVMALLTLIVYLAKSSTKESKTAQAEAKEAVQVKLEFQMEQARLNTEHKRAMAAQAAELKHAEKLVRIERQIVPNVSHETVPNVSHQMSQAKTLETMKADIIAELRQGKPNLTNLAHRLDIGRSTLYRHLGTLAERGEIVKNGNGYGPINS